VTIKDANVSNDTLVRVVVRIKNEGAQGLTKAALRRRNAGDDGFEHLIDVDAGFGRDADDLILRDAQKDIEVFFDLVHHGRLQVDLIDDGNDDQVGFEGEVKIGKGLGFDALGGIHDEESAFASIESTADLVVEIDMPGSIDEVKFEIFAILSGVGHANRGGFDSDALLALEIHSIEHLLGHIPIRDSARELEHTICQGRFAMIDMGYNAKIANFIHCFAVSVNVTQYNRF